MMLNGSANQLTSASGFLIFTLDMHTRPSSSPSENRGLGEIQQAAGSKVPEDHMFRVAPRRYVS